MKRTLEILRLIIYYALLFVFSSIGSNFMPISAIAMISAVYASGGILAPAIIVSAISVGVFISAKSLLILLIYLIAFLVPVIFIRPLVSIEGRNEKKKVGNYLILGSFITFVFFGFLESIYLVCLTYILYKIFVNAMAVIKNIDDKIVFSKEESISTGVLLSLGAFYISSYFNLSLLFPTIILFCILAYFAIKKGIIESILIYIFTIAIYGFLFIPNMDLNIEPIYAFNLSFNYILLLTIPIIVISIISLLRRFNRIVIYWTLSLINMGLFFFFYKYFLNTVYYFPYILMSFTVIIFASDYESLKAKKIRDSGLISDEGETRLETPIEPIDKLKKEKEEEKEKLKSRELIELYSDKDIFVNRMYINEETYKELSLYDEIQSSDYIFEEIYYLIQDEGYINRKKFNTILLKNNVIIDIYNYEVEEELRILEILALRELKRVVREREEKIVLSEREQALQNDKKMNESIEETDSIEYNKNTETIHKKESIRDIFKDKKDQKELDKKDKNKEEQEEK